MKILYISQYFHPEVCAPTNRALANVKYLADKKHDVTVLTEMPNHPKGIIFDEYKHKVFIKEKMNNFNVVRIWVFTSIKKSFITRMLFYLSFMLNGILYLLFDWKNYDAVYISSPPLFVSGIGLLISKLYTKTKILFEVRDLWPDSAIDLGELNNKSAIKLAENLEKAIYNKSKAIIVISEYMRTRLSEKGIDQAKIKLIHNGTDEEFITKEKVVPKTLKERYKKNEKFIIVYAGNLGIAQNISVIIKAAEFLQKEDVLFLLIGDGPRKKTLEQQAHESKLKNLTFVGEIKRELIHQYLCLADCGIINLQAIPLFRGALPSKIFDYMACNLPILIGVEGEAKQLVETSKTGIGFSSDSSDDLTQKILFLKNNPNILQSMKNNGSDFVLKNFNRNIQAKKIEELIKEIVEIQ